MRVSVCLVAILIPEYLDSHSGYSAPRSRIARIYSGIYSYSGISQTKAPLFSYHIPCFKTLIWGRPGAQHPFSWILGLRS